MCLIVVILTKINVGIDYKNTLINLKYVYCLSVKTIKTVIKMTTKTYFYFNSRASVGHNGQVASGNRTSVETIEYRKQS